MSIKHDDIRIKAFWRLYGLAVSGNPRLIEGFPELTDEDWETVYDIASRQQLAGLVVEAVGKLPAGLQPHAAQRRKWVAPLVKEIKRHADNNMVIADLFRRWHEAGLNPVLLKGQGLALVYEEPTQRIIGDIDVFVAPGEWDRAMDVVKALPLDTPDMPEIEKHVEFFYRRKCVELHRYAAELHHDPVLDAELKEWGNGQLCTTREGFRIDSNGAFAAEGEWIPVPTVDFNAFFIFQHFWEHVEIGMPKIRSLADLVFFLRVHRDNIDYALLEEKLARFKLLDRWKGTAVLLVDRLGLDPADIPFYDEGYRRQARDLGELLDREIAHIASRASAKGGIRRKLGNFIFYMSLYPVKFRMFPTRLVVRNFLKTIYLGLRNLG